MDSEQYENVKRNLLISEPDRIVARREEVRTIERFMTSALQLANPKSSSAWGSFDILEGNTGTGGRCLYISGMPGTGKTSTLVHILKKMQAERDEDDEYPEFSWTCVNARKLTQPQRVMSALCKNLTGQKQSPAAATKTLEEFFSSKGGPIVVVIDEIDFLISRSQKELYTLVDWPSKPKSRLIVIGIANTLDLPERLLMPRIASRFGNEGISFAPYSTEQLQQLISSRIGKIKLFHADAISFCAMSVASSFGDARRALNLAKKALEVANEQGHDLVLVSDVHKAVGQMGSLPPTAPILNCSLQEQVFLCSVIKELRITKNEYVYFSQVCQRHFGICNEHSFKKPTRIELSSVCNQLVQQKLLIATHPQNGVLRKIQLAHTQEEVTQALSLKSYTQQVMG